MNDAISQQQIDFYQQNGYLIIENFLDNNELETWRRVTEEAVAERMGEAPPGAKTLNPEGTLASQYARPVKNSDDYYSNVFRQCLRLADSHSEMRDLMFDERLGRAAGTLAQVSGIRIWHDQALIKPPFGNPTAWHLDNPYWSFFSRDAISLWVALDDATQANGCMWYLPGTHKTARYDNVGIGSNVRDLFKVYPEWLDIESQCGACKAGSAVFHNGLTAHGAGANMTPRPRRAMTCAYMPDGSVFNGQKNILPDAYFATLKEGDALSDDAQNPLIWRK